jgi:iron complex outermembrane recepter protein
MKHTMNKKSLMNRVHFAVASILGSASVLALGTAHAAEAPRQQTLDPVNITAQRLAEAEAERAATPGAVTVIDGTTLNERSVGQLADLLRYVPGVWAESYNGNDDVFYSSRGSNLDATDYDKNGVKFLQDGLPVTAADGNNHNRAVDAMNARYVTVAHGANALAYGASTLGGAIDFTSPTARTTAPFSASLSAGSFEQWNARATLGGASDVLDGLLSVETLQRDGYREHSEQDRKSIYANAGLQTGENVSTRFYATYSDFYAELPRELTPAQFAANPRQARADAIAGNHSKDVQTWRLAVKTTIAQVGGGTLELGVSHEQQSLYHPIVSSPFFSLLIDTEHKDSGAVLRYRKSAGAHALLFGANYGFSKMNGGNYENIGGEPGALMWMTDDDASSLELFAMDRWEFAPQWTLVYGTQFASARRDVGGFKGSYDSLNPRLGLIRNYSEGSQWFASISRTWEAPTTFELTDDANGGSTPLKAMHGVVLESGLRGTAMRGDTQLTWEVAGYYTVLRNEILSIDDPDAPGTSLSANIDKTTHAGIEALLGANFKVGDGSHSIAPLVNLTWNAFSFDSDPTYGNNRLPAAPRLFVRGEVLYRNTAGFFAGPTFDLVGKRYVDFANTYSVDSYELLGARAGFNSAHWEVFAEGRNLTNKKYVAAVVVKDIANPTAEMLHPGAPRSVYFGVRYRY